ncbi:hypothetical protein BV25DRAFT_1921443 [Artomyces pyxidatus]|uniref:Uncharacterized protein n=1 Tax=Artomyces pyxidatus TaxID=48021 RepID=A0ACB8SJ48_9AGAM|nr:hypothetical protein BV25DRAFT_1921443 [Artomyces pyxidatus]
MPTPTKRKDFESENDSNKRARTAANVNGTQALDTSGKKAAVSTSENFDPKASAASPVSVLSDTTTEDEAAAATGADGPAPESEGERKPLAPVSGKANITAEVAKTVNGHSTPDPVNGTERAHPSPATVHLLTPLPSPEDDEIPRRSHFSDTLIQRLKGFLSYSNDIDNTYSITRLPANIYWGPAGSSHVNNLCREGNAIPVVVWHLGEVRRTWFYNKAGGAAETISVVIRPLTASARIANQALIQKFTEPSRIGIYPVHLAYLLHLTFTAFEGSLDNHSDEVRAARWQTIRVPGERAAVALPFDRVYNATEKFERKANMRKLEPALLKPGDLVLLEAFISRYKERTDKTMRLTNTIRAISLLCSGVPSTDLDEKQDDFAGTL